MLNINIENKTLHVSGIEKFALYRSCNCGQTFRWTGEGDTLFCVIGRDYVKAQQSGDELFISPCRDEEHAKRYLHYFDLDRDYAQIEKRMSDNPILQRCIPYAGGIRVYNQEAFETLISFIVSANNNIKRITGIIDRLCRSYGERCETDDCTEYFIFPTAEKLAAQKVSDFRALGLGYRDEYIKRTAQSIADGFSLDELKKLPYAEAKKKLCTLHGVGGKVADCVLLFSLEHGEAFPMDVWMKRAVSRMFFDGREPAKNELADLLYGFGDDAGRIQQYIFHYARETELRDYEQN